MNKQYLVNIANETLSILKDGKYNYRRVIIDIKKDLNSAVENSILYKPNEIIEPNKKNVESNFDITNESTLTACKRLVNEGFKNIICLNFASAKNPGGGFLKGSIAQEESIAYSSGLYACIGQDKMREMYNYNKNLNGLYSDYMIYSPSVPVFRDDKYNLIDKHYNISIITAPAVNLNSVGNLSYDDKKKIKNVMVNRIDKILSICNIHNADAIVLGAFGCGVFRNDPKEVAKYFNDLLKGKYKNNFKQITFAIKTNDTELIETFSNILLNK